MKSKKRLSVERHQKRAGFLFLIPYLIGLIYFFIIPFGKTVFYSFNDVLIRPGGGMKYVSKGIENYRYILFTDAQFIKAVGNAMSKLLYVVPVVLIFSIFVALLLNQKFKGRMLMRGLFFLPVIIASGVVIVIINRDIFVKAPLCRQNYHDFPLECGKRRRFGTSVWKKEGRILFLRSGKKA